MKKILQKNYIILVVLLVVTIFLTLFLSNLYTSKNKLVSSFYEYANKITPTEIEEYITENPDTIIYISDKYNLSYETFETKLQKKIDSINLKEQLVYIDKNEIDEEFLKSMNTKYNLNIDMDNTPVIIIVVDKTIIKNIYVENYLNVETIIDYEVFK